MRTNKTEYFPRSPASKVNRSAVAQRQEKEKNIQFYYFYKRKCKYNLETREQLGFITAQNLNSTIFYFFLHPPPSHHSYR